LTRLRDQKIHIHRPNGRQKICFIEFKPIKVQATASEQHALIEDAGFRKTAKNTQQKIDLAISFHGEPSRSVSGLNALL
jgi:4-hydroxyphenylpyruvate dioxygenase-like putative hemolysin